MTFFLDFFRIGILEGHPLRHLALFYFKKNDILPDASVGGITVILVGLCVSERIQVHVLAL